MQIACKKYGKYFNHQTSLTVCPNSIEAEMHLEGWSKTFACNITLQSSRRGLPWSRLLFAVVGVCRLLPGSARAGAPFWLRNHKNNKLLFINVVFR